MHPGNIDLYSSVQFPEETEISEAARDLLENLIQHDPDDRPDYEQLKRHDFFKGIKWNELETNGLKSTKNIKK